jgi:hypothetical protein
MEHTHVSNNASISIILREGTLTNSETFEAKTFLIGSEVGELAYASMRMTMEPIGEVFEVGLPGMRSKFTTVEYCIKLASSFETTTLILSKHIEHLGGTCEGIFGPENHHVSWCLWLYINTEFFI